MLRKLRSWLSGLFGGPDAVDPDETESTDDQAAEPSGLDPDNVTEVRTEADEDPVEKLREMEHERQHPDDPRSGDGG